MKLRAVIEGVNEYRVQLLQLQRELIEELPDDVEVDLEHVKQLMCDCVKVTYKTKDDLRNGRATFRYLRPPRDYDPSRILRATPQSTFWSEFPKDAIIRMLKNDIAR